MLGEPAFFGFAQADPLAELLQAGEHRCSEEELRAGRFSSQEEEPEIRSVRKFSSSSSPTPCSRPRLRAGSRATTFGTAGVLSNTRSRTARCRGGKLCRPCRATRRAAAPTSTRCRARRWRPSRRYTVLRLQHGDQQKREEVEGPGVQRRALLVLLGLELGAALSRKKFEKVLARSGILMISHVHWSRPCRRHRRRRRQRRVALAQLVGGAGAHPDGGGPCGHGCGACHPPLALPAAAARRRPATAAAAACAARARR